MHLQQQLTTPRCHHCEGPTKAVSKEDRHGKRSVDRNFRLRIRGVDNSRNRRYRECNATINIPRKRMTAPVGKQSPAYVKPQMGMMKRKQPLRKTLKRLMLMTARRDLNFRLYARIP